MKDNKHRKKLLRLMEVLASHGPTSKYELAGEVSGVKKKKGLTSFSWVLVHKLLNELQSENLVKPFGKRKLTKHETTIYGLSFKGLCYYITEQLYHPERTDRFDKVKQTIQMYAPYLNYIIFDQTAFLERFFGKSLYEHFMTASAIVREKNPGAILRITLDEKSFDKWLPKIKDHVKLAKKLRLPLEEEEELWKHEFAIWLSGCLTPHNIEIPNNKLHDFFIGELGKEETELREKLERGDRSRKKLSDMFSD